MLDLFVNAAVSLAVNVAAVVIGTYIYDPLVQVAECSTRCP